MRTSRLARQRARNRRPLIMALSGLALLLQVLLLVGIPNQAFSPPTASPTAGAGRPGSPAAPPSGSGSSGQDGPENPHPTLTVPPPPGVAIPKGAVLLYTQTPNAAAPAASPQAGASGKPGGLHRPLTPQDLLMGLMDLHAHGRLDLTPEQARRLAAEIRDLDRTYTDFNRDRLQVLEALDDTQRAWLQANPPRPGDLPAGAPEENALAPAQRALQALDKAD